MQPEALEISDPHAGKLRGRVPRPNERDEASECGFKSPGATRHTYGAGVRWVSPGAGFIRRARLDSYHVVRDRSAGEEKTRRRKKGAKSPFVCGLRNRKKRQFTLLVERTSSDERRRVHTRPVHREGGERVCVCTCMCALDP